VLSSLVARSTGSSGCWSKPTLRFPSSLPPPRTHNTLRPKPLIEPFNQLERSFATSTAFFRPLRPRRHRLVLDSPRVQSLQSPPRVSPLSTTGEHLQTGVTSSSTCCTRRCCAMDLPPLDSRLPRLSPSAPSSPSLSVSSQPPACPPLFPSLPRTSSFLSARSLSRSPPPPRSPWLLTGSAYLFPLYTPFSTTPIPVPSGTYAPLEQDSKADQSGSFHGGVGAVMIVRYDDSNGALPPPSLDAAEY
jgi:hypothetical protein